MPAFPAEKTICSTRLPLQSKPEWEYIGVYADEAETGTKDARPEYQRLLADCRAGCIDLVLTKSISRFARNTVTLLEVVRELKDIGIDVYFEEQNLHSLSGDGDVMLTILASYAQEESRSVSENCKRRIRNDFKEGKPNSFCVYGYRWDGDKFVVEPEEAAIVRLIFANFLNGISAESTAKQLTGMGIKSYTGCDEFSATSVRAILRNDKYTGVLRLQKTYVLDHISHKYMINNGELPVYLVEDAHEAIVSKEDFNAVQAEQVRRRGLGAHANPHISTSVLTSKVKCGNCGASFHRRTENSKYKVWKCATKDAKGKAVCDMKLIPEPALRAACAEALGLAEFDDGVFAARVEVITAHENNTLVFRFTDGTEATKVWYYNSTARKDCWMPERRAAWSEQLKNRDKGGRWSAEARKKQSEQMKARYAENPDWNNRRKT